MDAIPLVRFDIRGEAPENFIPNEEIPLKDKTLNWLIPNGSPFFGEPGMVVMRNQAGALMRRDRDYYVEEDFVPFCEVSGRQVSTFIRISDAILRDNDFVSIDYQSIGAWFVPRNSLTEWLDQIHAGKTPIPWSKVFYVPPTLPSSLHFHDIKTEIGDWYDLTQFFATLEGLRSSRDPEFNDKLEATVKDAYKNINVARDDQLSRLQLHDRDYNNPHEADAFDVVMGNHPNYATATPAEDKAGVRSDVLSTPYGVIELAKTYVPDTDKAMFSGIMPISSFGSGNYIPPNITGSFEAQGGLQETSGMCKEPDGRISVISSHFDGRVSGLYYSMFKDYLDDDRELVFTGFKYNPPSLANQGIVCDRIVSGSGNDVIMVGQVGTNNWYIALTNGTFDPASHKFVKCGLGNVNSQTGVPVGSYPELMKVHYMGDYILLVVGHSLSYGTINNDDNVYMFIIDTNTIRNGNNFDWVAKSISYTDFNGNAQSGQSMALGGPVGSAGNYSRYGSMVFSPPAAAVAKNGIIVTLSYPKKGVRGVYYFHLMQCSSATYGSKQVGAIYEVWYEFTVATGVFVRLGQSPNVAIDFTKTQAELDANIYAGYQSFQRALASWWSQTSIVLSSGEILSAVRNGATPFPVNLELVKFTGKNSGSDLLAGSLHSSVAPVSKWIVVSPVSIAPMPVGVAPTNLSYDTDGELWSALELGTAERGVFMRRVTGDYQVRPGINNLTLGTNILSRPLTNDVFKTNLTPEDGLISVTGTAADLTARGSEMGTSALSMCGWSSKYPIAQYLPINPDLRAPAPADAVITFPRTHKRTLDTVKRTAKYTGDTFFGMRQAVVDQIKALIPAGNPSTPGWAFTLTMINPENGGMFTGLSLGILELDYFEGTNTRTRLISIRPTIEAPNASHPGVYMITGFTVLDSTTDFLTADVVLQGRAFSRNDKINYQMPGLICYRTGNTLTGYLVGGWWVSQANNSHRKITSVFTLNASTGVFSFAVCNAYFNSYLQPEPVAIIPKVGLTDFNYSGSGANFAIGSANPTQFAYTGQAASIIKKDSSYYLTMSCYLDLAWVLYFLEEVPVLINGAEYAMPKGSLDLRDIDPAPQNKTFYVYATLENGTAKYILSSIALRKNNSMMRVATITTNDKQILTITREQPFMIADLLLSYTREGGIIPLSAGFPQDEGSFIFLHQAELLP